MGKQNKPAPKNSFKYGMPLYGAAWPEGDVVFVAGGGGQGIQNRLVFARYKNADHELHDQLGAFNFGSDCPTRTQLHPSGKYLLVALSSKKLRCFRIQTKGVRLPKIFEVTGELHQRLQRFSSGVEVKSLAFSSTGAHLAIGYEGGEVEVLRWPSLQSTQLHLRGETALKDDIRDLDFSPVHADEVLAVTSSSGNCEIWQINPPTCLSRITAPSGTGRCRIDRCRFARDGSKAAYTMANGPEGTHLMLWEEVGGKGQMKSKRVVLASKHTSVAFDISPDGALLGVATSEGDILALSSRTLQMVKMARKAHMVFPTGLTFSQDSNCLLSISMDASACVTDLRATPPATSWLAILSALILLIALAVGLALQVSDGSPNPSLQFMLSALKTASQNISVGAPAPAHAASASFSDGASMPFPHTIQHAPPAPSPAAAM